MPRRHKPAQGYSPEEFDAVVDMIRNDPGLRADIEAITGQTLDGRTPRELFDLFRAIDTAADIQVTVAKYGRARQLVRQTRNDMQHLPPADMPVETSKYVADVQRRMDEVKAENAALKAALRAGNVHPIPDRPVIQGEVAS